VPKQLGDQLPEVCSTVRRIVNVRPALATSFGREQIKKHAGSPALETELKKIWDQVCENS